MDKLLKQFKAVTTSQGDELIYRIIISIATLAFLWLISMVVRKLFISRIANYKVRYRWSKTLSYIHVFLAIVLIGQYWFDGVKSLATFFGLLSAGIAISLKDPLVNLAGWLFIIGRRPFELGDRIQIGDHTGDVIDIRAFQFTLLEVGNWVHAEQSTGRMIHIPNGNVFMHSTSNYQAGFSYIWNEIPVLLTFESNWQKAKKILEGIIEKHSRNTASYVKSELKEASKKYMIMYTHLSPIVYTSVKDSGIELTIRYLCKIRSRRTSSETLWEMILTKFAECKDIDFAYPTIRYYDNKTEGKETGDSS